MKNIQTSTKILRVLVPVLLLAVWLTIGAVGGKAFGQLSSKATNDQANFLPASADSTKVQNVEKNFVGSKVVPAIIVVESNRRLAPHDLAQLAALRQKMIGLPGESAGPSGIAGPIPSQDGQAVEFIIPLSSDTDQLKSAVAELRSNLNGILPAGMHLYVTGPAGIFADLFKAFQGIDSTLLYVAIAAVFIILVIVYRSAILPFLVLGTAMFALCGAGLVVYFSVAHGWLKLNSQSQGILSILAIGAATDYSLLLVSRYHEALTHTESKWDAIWQAVRGTIEPVSASAATVIAGVLCLLFSELNSNKDLGPVAAVGIAFSYLSAMTFLPTLLLLFGRRAFWPFNPKFIYEDKAHAAKLGVDYEHRKGVWGAIPRYIARRPRLVWAVCLVVLLAAAFAEPQFKANGVSQSDAILGKSDAVAGQKILAKHFPAGSGSPVIVIVGQDRLRADTAVVQHTSGVVMAQPLTTTMVMGRKKVTVPVVINGQALIQATMNVPADSLSGQQVVQAMRTQLKAADPAALVGGTTAIELDTNQAATRDLHKILPIVLGVILIILMILLRAILAPVLLIASVILSFTATLGFSALVFNHVFSWPGSDAAIPLFSFIFLVALGVDYNIFLMTRVREESIKHGTRRGILGGLSVTGGVITSAGIVLAATFASLSVIPILFLAQIAFIVTAGVLIDTLVVRTLLVPAVSYDIGKAIWWPAKLWRKGEA